MKNLRVFVSVELSTRSNHDNTMETLYAKDALELLGLPFKQVDGMYNGVAERSFMLSGEVGQNMALILAELNNQESILLVDDNNDATLVYLRDAAGDKVWREEVLGKFVEVDANEALESTAYSKIDGKYYMVK